MDFLVLRVVDNGPQEVKQSFIALESLKQINQSFGRQLFMILGRNLDANLKILPNIIGKHCPKTFQRIFHTEGAKIIDEPLAIEQMGVHNLKKTLIL